MAILWPTNGNTNQRAGDDPAGRSGELASKPGRSRKPVEHHAGNDADCENQNKRNGRVGGLHDLGRFHRS